MQVKYFSIPSFLKSSLTKAAFKQPLPMGTCVTSTFQILVFTPVAKPQHIIWVGRRGAEDFGRLRNENSKCYKWKDQKYLFQKFLYCCYYYCTGGAFQE